MLLLCSPTDLCAFTGTGLGIQMPSGTGQTDLTTSQWRGQHHQMPLISLSGICKMCRTKLRVSSLVTRGSCYPHCLAAVSCQLQLVPLPLQQPKASQGRLHNQALICIFHCSASKPLLFSSTAVFHLCSGNMLCFWFLGLALWSNHGQAVWVEWVTKWLWDNSGFWTPTQNKGELCQGSGEPGVSTQTGYWRKHERRVFILWAMVFEIPPPFSSPARLPQSFSG